MQLHVDVDVAQAYVDISIFCVDILRARSVGFLYFTQFYILINAIGFKCQSNAVHLLRHTARSIFACKLIHLGKLIKMKSLSLIKVLESFRCDTHVSERLVLSAFTFQVASDV